MRDLTQRNKINIRPGGGLHSRIAQSELQKEIAPPSESIDPSKMEHRLGLMLDCSGSMNGESIKQLSLAVQDFISKADFSNTAMAIETFPSSASSRINLISDKTILWLHCMSFDANGGTPMSEAMIFVKGSYHLTRAIIISDGQPDSPESCKIEARYYKEKEIPIDCIHISESSSGEELLKSIADITGGIYVKFKDTSSFASAMHFLLPETRAQAATLFLTAGADEVKS
jgi:Mg-chelatase subunit ChlD